MKRWYVVQVYAGDEEAVQRDLERRIVEFGNDLFGRVLLPSAKSRSMFALEEEQEDERLFPGYVLVEMEKTNDALALVSSTPRVLKFLGGKDPVPLLKSEISRILSQVSGEVAVAAKPREAFVDGSEVDIQEGPFAGFVGIISRVDEESEKLTVMVSIFGRLTPVELTFDQVKK